MDPCLTPIWWNGAYEVNPGFSMWFGCHLTSGDRLEWEFSGATHYRYCDTDISACNYSDMYGVCDDDITLWAKLYDGEEVVASGNWNAEDINGFGSC
jgi:hypothetical protein